MRPALRRIFVLGSIVFGLRAFWDYSRPRLPSEVQTAERAYQEWRLGTLGEAANRAKPQRPTRALDPAHRQRRGGLLEGALAHYSAAAWTADDRAARNQAARWQARTFELLGRERDALQAWHSLERGAKDPGLRILAGDRIALTLARTGREAAARKVLVRTYIAHARQAAQATPLGERLRQTLGNMRAPRLLQLFDWPPALGAPTHALTPAEQKKIDRVALEGSQAPIE